MIKEILHNIKKIFSIIYQSFRNYNKDNTFKLCASLSYYTIFSMPPLLLIIISLSGIFFGPEAVSGELFSQIRNLVGDKVALEIQTILRNIKLFNNNSVIAIFSSVMLFVSAAGVFTEIQSSLQLIWKMEKNRNKGIIYYITNKALSFAMIGCVAFLMMVSLIINTGLGLISSKISFIFQDSTVLIIRIFSSIFVYLSITILFLLIYKTLPNKNMKWKYTIVASAVTSFLFMIGKNLIGLYLSKSNTITIYGAAGSLIVILLWVYYISAILYFGAHIIKAYANYEGNMLNKNA